MTLLHPRVVPPIVECADPEAAPRRVVAQAREGARRPALCVEYIEPFAAAAHREAWIALADRALEPNPFLDADFALPAAQHVGGARRPGFALVWAAEAGRDRTLVGVCPIAARRGPLRASASAWMHDLATLGFPLLDRDFGEGALAALIAWAGREFGAASLVVPSLPDGGPTATALRAAASAGGSSVAVLHAWERAVLRRGSGRAGLPALSRKGAKELRRQRRRLAERGALAYASAAAEADLPAAVEQFLALEARGWKGAAGTALLCSPGRTAFARAATRLLGRRGLCRVDSLALDGVPVAMAVILSAGSSDALWKIAYSEDLAGLSPGVQLVLEITEAQRGAGRAALTDSCAVPDHPMIDRLWRDRLRLCDVAVSTRPGAGIRFRSAVAVGRAARRLRGGAKRLVLAWRARRGGA